MHNLKPNTKYKILTVHLAVEDVLADSSVIEEVDRVLQAAVQSRVVDDYAFCHGFVMDKTGAEPKTGDPFRMFHLDGSEMRRSPILNPD